jgi:molybdopterin converting factor small subunit
MASILPIVYIADLHTARYLGPAGLKLWNWNPSCADCLWAYVVVPCPVRSFMQVTVKLFATLTRFSPGGLPATPFEINLPDSATVKDLVYQLGIPSEETKISFVNGLIRDLDWVLKQGDEVGIFPPIGGG